LIRKHARVDLSAPSSSAPPSAAQSKPASRGTSAKRSSKSAHVAVAGALPPAQIPREALAAPARASAVAIALGVSIALHALVLAIHFSPFDLTKFANKEAPLEVALVNAKSETKPVQAEILAQANLDGGGNTDQKRRAKTPLPVPKEVPTKEVSVPAAKPEPVKEPPRMELMTQIQSKTVLAPGVKTQSALMPHQAALDPVGVVEDLGAAHQHAAVVRPDRHRLVADLLGALDVLLEAAFALVGRVLPDAVGGVDIHAVLRETTSRALPVHRQLEEGGRQDVTGDQQIPVRRHGVEGHGLRVISPCL